MAEPLTAAQLIALLREHPLTCGALEVDIDDDYFEDGSNEVYIGTCDSLLESLNDGRPFRRWLTGALVDAHVERVISMPVLCWESSRWRQPTGQLSYSVHPTILHALLAGLESNLKETSK